MYDNPWQEIEIIFAAPAISKSAMQPGPGEWKFLQPYQTVDVCCLRRALVFSERSSDQPRSFHPRLAVLIHEPRTHRQNSDYQHLARERKTEPARNKVFICAIDGSHEVHYVDIILFWARLKQRVSVLLEVDSMLIKYKLFDAKALSFLLVFSSAGFAHDGHQDQDMLIPNLGNLGIVNFPVACSDNAQKAVNTGVGLIHHMMYAQAEQLFGSWIEREPDCAMLYWGYSMTLFHPLWPDTITEEALDRGSIAIKKAQALETSERELSYINAAAAFYDNWQTNAHDLRTRAWAEAQQGVYQKYPSDIDAGAFRALAQIVTAPKTDPTFSQNREAGALLEKLNKISPTHPGSIHYTIHAYDSAPLAELAIDYARAYDKIAPDVPHALHMPSHIFVRLGMWDDAISWNIRSAKAALNYPTKGSTSMHYVHAMDYLIYGYLQLEQGEAAKQAMQSMAAHQPVQPTFPAAYAFAAIPARLALEQQQWQQASAIETQNPDYIAWEKFPQVEAITYYARGLGAARLGDLKKAGENVSALDALFEKTQAISPAYWAPLVDAQRQVVNAWISYEAGDTGSALAQLRKAADLEDSMDKNPVTPGAVLPARELLADMLMLRGDYAGALLAYEESLGVSPNRSNSLAGVARAKLAMAQ